MIIIADWVPGLALRSTRWHMFCCQDHQNKCNKKKVPPCFNVTLNSNNTASELHCKIIPHCTTTRASGFSNRRSIWNCWMMLLLGSDFFKFPVFFSLRLCKWLIINARGETIATVTKRERGKKGGCHNWNRSSSRKKGWFNVAPSHKPGMARLPWAVRVMSLKWFQLVQQQQQHQLQLFRSKGCCKVGYLNSVEGDCVHFLCLHLQYKIHFRMLDKVKNLS